MNKKIIFFILVINILIQGLVIYNISKIKPLAYNEIMKELK